MPNLEDLVRRVEHLLVRHAELQRTQFLLQQQVSDLTAERDAARQKLAAARARIDALIARLPAEPNSEAKPPEDGGEPGRGGDE
jgi:chromosome segregation ATPase